MIKKNYWNINPKIRKYHYWRGFIAFGVLLIVSIIIAFIILWLLK